MKLRLTLISLIAATLFAAGEASAAETVAVINIQQILKESTAGKSINDQLDSKRKAIQSEMSKKEARFNKEQEGLGQQKAVLSPDAFGKKVKEFRAEVDAAQKDAQMQSHSFDAASNAASYQIEKAILEIVGKISKERGYTIVMPASQLLYADPKLDITSEVLTQLNSTLPNVSVNFDRHASSSSKQEE